MAVGQPQGMLLNEFGDLISKAFGTSSVYHVGSSMGDDKKNWRDVDVRVMLDDEQWANLFADLKPQDCHGSPKWRSLCIVFAHYGRHMTGLPIDFQIQRIREANDEYPMPRSHMGTHNL
jgi:hypothetical protein